MSQCLSNLPIFQPLPTETSCKWPFSKSFSPTRFHPSSRRIHRIGGIRAMGSEGRENLDHLQRQSKHQQPQQQQIRRKSAPVAPVGKFSFYSSRGWPSSTSPPLSPAETAAGGYSRGRTPWEIKESESEYKMRFDMPGMTKEDVKVWIEEKMLVLKAEKISKKKETQLQDEEEEEWGAKSYGKYSCRIALPENVEFEKIKAEVKDGVLYITIPKATNQTKILDINVQ